MPSRKLYLGRVPSIHPQNMDHPMRGLLPMRARIPGVSTLVLPKVKSWRFDGPPLDQGETGTCVAHSASHFWHAEPFRHRGFLNPFDLYREIVLHDEYASNDHEANLADNLLQAGTSGTGAAKALQKRGLIGEYVWGKSVGDVILWLQSRGCVMLGSNWYPSFFTPDAEGFIKFQRGQRSAGGHETLLRGVDLRRGTVEGINSWGPGWNAGARLCRPGHFLMEIETLERLMIEEGDAVSAIEVGPRGRTLLDQAGE